MERVRQEARQERQEARPAHEDRVRRQLRADRPNQLWLWDVTEHPTAEGKLCLCAIKDVFSNRVVGYSISDRTKSRIAANALVSAVARRGQVAGCIVQPDRGSQLRSRKVLRELDRHDLVGSMGHVASVGDNAAMESFFSLLQKNVLNRRTYSCSRPVSPDPSLAGQSRRVVDTAGCNPSFARSHARER